MRSHSHALLWLAIWMLWMFSASDRQVRELQHKVDAANSEISNLRYRVQLCRCKP